MSQLRSLRRTVAHNNMRRLGYASVNDHKYDRSFFATSWRDYVHEGVDPNKDNRKVKRRKAKNGKDKQS